MTEVTDRELKMWQRAVNTQYRMRTSRKKLILDKKMCRIILSSPVYKKRLVTKHSVKVWFGTKRAEFWKMSYSKQFRTNYCWGRTDRRDAFYKSVRKMKTLSQFLALYPTFVHNFQY